MKEMLKYLRANPQLLVLLAICVVLGFGTFLAVALSLLGSGSATTSGEPSGSVAIFQAMVAYCQWFAS